MLRSLIALVFCCAAFAAQAVTFNCTGTGAAPNRCTFISDNAPTTTVQPATCKIYNTVDSSVIASGAVWAATGGALYCHTSAPVLGVGTYTVTAAFVGTDGVETAQSAPYTFSVGLPLAPLPPPSNLRVTSP